MNAKGTTLPEKTQMKIVLPITIVALTVVLLAVGVTGAGRLAEPSGLRPVRHCLD